MLQVYRSITIINKAFGDSFVKGSYALVLQLTDTAEITIGRFGTYRFNAGYYLYFGSALNGLERRIDRHLRSEKKLYWHIDFLSEVAEVREVWRTYSSENAECCWTELAKTCTGASTPVLKFGSSDCIFCKSHLIMVTSKTQVDSIRRRIQNRFSHSDLDYVEIS